MLDFHGDGVKLLDQDLPRLGHQIGVGEDEIHAVLDVETRGGGFDSSSRPKILFEPHVFYKKLGPGPKREKAIRLGLAYRRWGQTKYPRDSYPRLIEAMKIDRDAALKSCSWGLGQVMGFNYEQAGFDSVVEMVEAFKISEGHQLEGMINFIVANNLDDELRDHDWRGFARGYNGPAYAKNNYHTKLAKAFAKWQRIPDTPFDVDRTEVDPNEGLAIVDPETATGLPDVSEPKAATMAARIDDSAEDIHTPAEVLLMDIADLIKTNFSQPKL